MRMVSPSHVMGHCPLVLSARPRPPPPPPPHTRTHTHLPSSFAVGNTMKRVAVVVSSVLFFKNPVSCEWGRLPSGLLLVRVPSCAQRARQVAAPGRRRAREAALVPGRAAPRQPLPAQACGSLPGAATSGSPPQLPVHPTCSAPNPPLPLLWLQS